MKRYIKWTALIAVITLFAAMLQACESASNASPPIFQISTSSIEGDGTFKVEQTANAFGCTGGNQSPDLMWTGAPEGTQSFAITVLDEDAHAGSGFWHWIMFNIPVTVSKLQEGVGDPNRKLAPEGSVQSINDAGKLGYVGACPQGLDPHRYTITVFALKTDKIPFEQFDFGREIGPYLNENALAKTSLTVLHKRK